MELRELQDKYKDKTGFVIGAGPSLHFQDVEPLKEYVTIAVNSGLAKAPFCNYFVSDDIGVQHYNYYLQLLPDLTCIKLLYKDKLENHVCHLKRNEIVWFKHKWWYDPKNKKYNPTGLVLTKDAELPIVGARTSSGTAIHILYIMGCNPIILLGIDCCYGVNEPRKRYFWQYDGEYRVARITTHEPVFAFANKGFYKNTKYPIDSHGRDFLQYWDAFVQQNKSTPDLHIINASGGILEAFERMSLEKVLEKYRR